MEAAGSKGLVFVRDSRDRTGPLLAFPDCAWRNFVAGLTRRT
jgi:hypothetical protein